MLAAEVIPSLIHSGHAVFSTDINQRLPEIKRLDITQKEDIFGAIGALLPDYVFHLAAETNVDLCEEKPLHAFRVNAQGTENIALACDKFDVPMLYISTSSVFSGDKKTPYRETDKTGPVNAYGKSKLEGEKIVRSILKKYFIIRAGWMVGGWEIDKKFVFKIAQQLKQGKNELTVVADKSGSPTFTKDFAANLLNVINTEKYGLYHMANRGTCSRYDMALKIVDFSGLTGKVKVRPIGSDKFPLPAPRPDSEMLENFNLEKMHINNMPSWEDSLRIYIAENLHKN